MSPTKEGPATLSPLHTVCLALDSRRGDAQKLLNESPRRRRIDETICLSFLKTLPEKEWERYRSKLERKTGVTWNRVAFMERNWDVICRYGTQSVIKVGLNQPIMLRCFRKLMSSTESDDLTESVTEDNADDCQLSQSV